MEARMHQTLRTAALLSVTVLAIAPLGGLAADSASAAQTTVAKAIPGVTGDRDPFLWLEDRKGARALAWVKKQDVKTLSVLTRDPHYAAFDRVALAINESPSRIPYPDTIGGAVYNFWQDATHVRGIWRRTTLASYRTSDPKWTTVLDLDKLAKAEHANWVWEGADCELPQQRYCMISLSNGGEDAVSMREFDLKTDRFVTGGFTLPRGKQSTAWESPSTLLVARAWAPGEVTTSGYAYDVRRLRRGQPLSAAVPVFKGKKSDVSVQPFTLHDGQGHQVVMIDRGVTFFTSEYYVETPKGLQRLVVPDKSDVQGLVNGRLLLSLNQDWTIGGKTLPSGALVSIPLANVMSDPAHPDPSLVYAPGPKDAIAYGGVATTKHDLLVSIMHDVNGRELIFTPSANGGWTQHRMSLPNLSTIAVVDTNLRNDNVFFSVTGFLTPSTLYLGDASTLQAVKIKALPSLFDASNDIVEQHWATSKDGTRVPYYVVRAKNMRFDGTNPTILYGYGGFALSVTPYYSGVMGRLWLQRGGVFAVANIRGGGEFGPRWHQAAMTVHRQRAYDDFYAVAKALVDRKITDPRHLGIEGASNGGLLMGVEFTQHPEMYDAVDMGVPLLDMMRYEKIEAGASWVGEYGSVSNPVQRALLRSISPYENLKPGVAYPQPFIWTTTKDDRVGPQAARKFAAKLAAMGVPYYFYEVTEGGHAPGANLKEDSKTQALQYTYFTEKLASP
jgi:prolyl oligopeptidase